MADVIIRQKVLVKDDYVSMHSHESSTSNITHLIALYHEIMMHISHPWLAGETKNSKNDEGGPRIFGFVGTHVEHPVLRFAQDGERGRTTIGGKLSLQLLSLSYIEDL